jgi:hypothetical protein
VEHEPRNSINLCSTHHSDFDGYRFFMRWVPLVSLNSEMMAVFSYYQQAHIFIFINFSRDEDLEQFHGKSVVLDAAHQHSPFPAPFLIQEMRTRGFHPWYTDRPISYPRSTTYTLDNNSGGGVTDLGGGSDTGVGLDGMGRPGGSGGAVSSSSGPPSDQEYLILGNPFQDPELLESMCHEWQQLPNWKSAQVEGLTWEGTAEENARKYTDLVGVSTTVKTSYDGKMRSDGVLRR